MVLPGRDAINGSGTYGFCISGCTFGRMVPIWVKSFLIPSDSKYHQPGYASGKIYKIPESIV